VTILDLLDELHTIARNGLAYSRNVHDTERYRRLVELASEQYSALTELPAAAIRDAWARELGHITPKVGAEAAVFDEAGRLLVLRRADDGRWGLPGGWLDPNETPEECAVRETREETGLEVRALGLVGVFTRKPATRHGMTTAVAVLYLCERVGGVLRGSHESTAVDFLRVEDVPNWHGWHREHADAALAARAAADTRPGR
jgi:ADP-ribose pyrophosphatase YjhB (NUDIX family)